MRRPLELNWENDESMWVDADWLRENADQLHPGFRAKMDELIAIAFGDSSPAGSRSTDDSITVVRVTPHRVGFAGHAVVRNLSRGKPHDPHAVHHVEVLLEADDADTLRDLRRVHQVAREAAAMHGVRPGFARTVSGVYPAGGMGAPRWRVRVDVE